MVSVAHWVSALLVPATLTYWLAVHAAWSVQPRSVVADGAADSHCVSVQLVSAVHVRSEVAVLAVLSYCTPGVHMVRRAHSRLE